MKMFKLFIPLVFFIGLANSFEFEYLNDFLEFVKKYDREYNDVAEFWSKYYTFEKNMKYINEKNSQHLSFTLAMNKFGDLNLSEFKELYTGLKYPKQLLDKNTINNDLDVYKYDVSQVLPESIDWRAENLVTPIKNQQACGSCWAFSAVGAMEGQHSKKTGKLVSLSEQNLVDCSQKFGNYGCNGGWPNEAMEYVIWNKGIDTEKLYPYTGQDGNCNYNSSNTGANFTKVINITQGDVNGLLNAVGTIGPISVAVDVVNDFQFYSHGIYESTECMNDHDDLNHAITVVGYGMTSTGKKYYTIKNSWGTDWGVSGYIYFSRDIDNMCGIAEAASYPIV